MIDLKTMLNEGEEDNLSLSAKCSRRAGYLECLQDVVDFIVFGDNVSHELKCEIMPFLNERCIKAVIATKNDNERVKELEDNIVDIEARLKRKTYC